MNVNQITSSYNTNNSVTKSQLYSSKVVKPTIKYNNNNKINNNNEINNNNNKSINLYNSNTLS